MSRTTRALLAAAAVAAVAACAGAVARRPAAERASAWISASAPEPLADPVVPCALGVVGADGATALERALRDAMIAARFDEVIDLGPTEDATCGDAGRCAPAPIAHRPSVDVAVIAFPDGCLPTFASARLSRDLPGVLGEQAYHDVLSTTALCGVARTAKGIPALLPARWVDDDGHVRVEGGTSTTDVRPCNAEAEVTFAHKTGLTLNFGSDAGVVRGIPGRARRHYIVAFFSNLGHRYTDPDKADVASPCRELGVCYTQRIAAMAAALDGVLAAALEAPRPGRLAPSR